MIQKIQFFDPEWSKSFAEELAAEAKDNPGARAYKAMGTTMMAKKVNQAGAFPTK